MSISVKRRSVFCRVKFCPIKTIFTFLKLADWTAEHLFSVDSCQKRWSMSKTSIRVCQFLPISKTSIRVLCCYSSWFRKVSEVVCSVKVRSDFNNLQHIQTNYFAHKNHRLSVQQNLTILIDPNIDKVFHHDVWKQFAGQTSSENSTSTVFINSEFSWNIDTAVSHHCMSTYRQFNQVRLIL